MDTDPAWIEELLKNNLAPSHEAVQEVRRLVLKPLEDLEHLDAEILELRNRLSELETKRDETQKKISRYKPILSPIRRVPPDVLGEIFQSCLPTHRNPIMQSSDCPLLLTRVCSTWRVTALTTPRLWDRLYITFTDRDTVPDLESVAEMVRNGQYIDGWRDGQPKEVKECTTEMLRRRCEAVKEWFLRAGARPLSISISFMSTPWYFIPYSERQPSVTMEFLTFLASLAPRWKEFEVKATMRLYRTLENMLPVSQMAALSSFRAECHPEFPESEDEKLPLKVFNAPNIRKISMSASESSVWGIGDHSSTRFHKLTNISCLNALTIMETIFLLEHSSSLVHYKGIISEYSRDHTPTVYEGFISLPFLRSISITEFTDPRRIGNIYDRIDAPKLQWVKYSSQFHPYEFSAENPASIPILPLLRKSMELQYLSVDPGDLTVWDVATLLRAIPPVTNLVIGEDDRTPVGSIMTSAAYLNYDDFGFLGRRSWSFSDLIVDLSSEDLDNDSDILLPQLQSLIIRNPSALMSDDTLVEIIKSRMMSKKTAILSQVKAKFYREKERDIVEELTTYAEHLGMKINLDLEYVPPASPAENPTSASFALRGKDGRSWPYTDAGEYL